MQDKVRFTPPTLKLFEGKPPPTSWFNTNIVHYFQIKSQKEFLTDFITFLQQAAAEKLTKTKQEGKQVLEFAYAPEEGEADQIAQATTFNTLQAHVGTEIQFLIKLIAILKEGNPKMAQELDEALVQLNTMAKGFPKLTEEQLSTLSKLLARLNEQVKKTSPSTQQKFWEEECRMLERMMKTHQAALDGYESEITTTERKQREMQRFQKECASLFALFREGKVPEALSQLVVLLKKDKNLPPESKKILDALLKKAAPFAKQIAHGQIAQWIGQLGGKPSREELIKYIREQLDDPPFNGVTPPFMADFVSQINKQLDDPDFPDNLEQTLQLDMASDDDIQGLFTEQHAQYQAQIQGQKKGVQAMGEVGKNLGKSAAAVTGHAMASGSLPDDFSHAILHHYMPNQEKYLMELAELLMFANMGAQIGNALLSMITDFSAAASNYDFSNSLNGDGKGQFSGSATQAQNQISKETNQAYHDLKRIEEALKKIEDEIKKIQNNKNLTPSQKKEMISKLQHIHADLKVSEGQLQNLYNLLKQLHVHPGSDSKHFKVSGPQGWQKALSHAEDKAINGDPKQKPGGGLVNIAAEINTFQQTYSDQGQNQQMKLQMRMTEIQQEWTVVSTALQLLNQMYMTVAQGIYK